MTAVDVRPAVAPWDPRDPDFLLEWRLETELQTAREADTADWVRAARAVIVHPRRRGPYVRADGRRDHPGGPVPAWGPTAPSPRGVRGGGHPFTG